MRCEKKVWKSPKKVWNRWYKEIFIWKPTQTLYSFVALIQVVVMVQIENFKVWKRCEITIKQYKIVCIELAGCMSYGSSPYENTRDQINKYISMWVNRPTNIFSTQINGLPYTISRKLFPRGALIFILLNRPVRD